MSIMPQLGEQSPPGVCSGYRPDGKWCPNEPKWHIIWTAEIENGLACDEHMAEARRRWCFYAVHQYDEVTCSSPHAWFIPAINRCVVDPPGNPAAEVERELVDA